MVGSLADCCARAASGQAAPPPSATSNSRRPMVTVMRPSRARARKCNDTTPRWCSLHVRGGSWRGRYAAGGGGGGFGGLGGGGFGGFGGSMEAIHPRL